MASLEPPPKQTVLARLLGACGTLDGSDGVVNGSEHLFPAAKRIDSAGLDETFKHALVKETGLDASAEIVRDS